MQTYAEKDTIVGNTEFSRDLFYKRTFFKVSCWPGRDNKYEMDNLDYPIEYVRWTETYFSFLNLLDKKINTQVY